MTLSVVIPSSQKDYRNALRQQVFCLSRGAAEAKVITEGRSIAEARNIGIARTYGDEILILDADMILPANIDLSSLSSYNYDLATAWYETVEPLDNLVIMYQNFMTAIGSPLGVFGGFMYFKRKVFRDVGPFREMPGEDIEWATRAWLRGWKVKHFDFVVKHGREFHWANAIGPIVNEKGEIWGLPMT
jgi:glycosyltransferase involved in cell wall biosynthesis